MSLSTVSQRRIDGSCYIRSVARYFVICVTPFLQPRLYYNHAVFYEKVWDLNNTDTI